MPTITVFPDVVRAYNRVEVNWSDLPAVTHSRVLRVDVETGECTPLRPYICFEGDNLLLSCGHGIFFDTEVPLDRSVYYITESDQAPCLPVDANLLFLDTFSRILVDSWGSTETGILSPLPYALTGGVVPGNYDVTGTKGTHALTTIGARISTVDLGRRDFDLYSTTSTNQTALTTDMASRTVARYVDSSNYYFAGWNWATTGALFGYITKLVAGVETILEIDFVAGTYSPNVEWSMRFQGHGNTFRFKMWPTAAVEPSDWKFTVTDSTPALNGTQVGLLSIRDVGNTNVGAVISWDDFRAIDECPPCDSVTATSEPTTMPSNGAFRLKDPQRPCNDVYMPLCFDSSTLARHVQTGQYCAPGGGVFFASMETESYEPNTLTVNPTNARRPIAITRQRRDVSSNLTMVSRTFNDRDALLRLVNPGSPILLQGPPQYGIPDRYMDIGQVNVDRGLTDHRFQTRIIQMPHVAVNRPVGPQTGVCGSRVQDLCDFTFDELADGGNTWEDLVRGRPTGGLLGYRDWDEVLGEFADWNDVDDGTRDWVGVEVGE